MFDKKEAHFAGDYFFENQALGTTTAAQVSDSFELGCTEGGIRVHGWLEGSAACASGNTITAKVQVGDKADSTAGSDWTDVESSVVTASGTSVSGDIVSVIPDTGKKFMRVSVANSTGMTGSFTVAAEYVPR
jgi:hypothetical protein